MGRRGPAPTPTPILKLHGSWRGDYRPDGDMPEDAMGVPAAPEWLDGDALKAWNKLAPQLDRLGVLAHIDENAFARYCVTWAEWNAMRVFIGKHGSTYKVTAGDGSIKGVSQYPQVKIMDALAGRLNQLEQAFGFTPSSRANLQIQAKGHKNSSPLEQLQREAKGG